MAFLEAEYQPDNWTPSSPWRAGSIHKIQGLICTEQGPAGNCNHFQPGPWNKATLEALAGHYCRPKQAKTERLSESETYDRLGKRKADYGPGETVPA